jgi:hypothetical protein
VKSLKPREGGPGEDLCLAAVEEDGGNDGLLEPRGYERQDVLVPMDLRPDPHGPK